MSPGYMHSEGGAGFIPLLLVCLLIAGGLPNLKFPEADPRPRCWIKPYPDGRDENGITIMVYEEVCDEED